MSLKSMKLNFGFAPVAAGQKNATVNARPQLIANSTTGKFTVTSAVTRALGVAPGENIMFLNNIAAINEAIQMRVQDIIDYANEQGIDIDTAEGKNAIIDAFSAWSIAKGVAMLDKAGQPVMVSERMTKDEKRAYLNANMDSFIEANHDDLIKKYGEMSDEELVNVINEDEDILDMITREVPGFNGSKTATTSNGTGIGLQLGFTDTNVWTNLKRDIEEEQRTKLNRIFNVDLENGQTVKVNNGFESVDVIAYPLEYCEDVEPMERGRKNTAAEDAE